MFELHRLPGICLAMALLTAACTDDAEPSTPDGGSLREPASPAKLRWVGAVDDSDVRVAMIAGGGKARLYFCGGPSTYARATHWFNIDYDSGEHVEFEQDNWRIHAHLLLDGMSGEVDGVDDSTRTFRATLVTPSSLAGLYEGKADCGRVGVIVTQPNKGAAPSAQGACTSSTGKPPQPVEPIVPEAGSIEVRARTPGGGDATLLLRAAALEPL